MEDVKIYLMGLNIVLESDGVKKLIPTRTGRVQPYNDFIQIEDNEADFTRRLKLEQIQDADGNTFATMDDALLYLTDFIGGFKEGGADGEGSEFSGSYNDLSDKPVITVSSTKVIDTGLRNETQNTNADEREYAWDNTEMNTTHLRQFNNGKHNIFKTKGNYIINANIRVTDAVANERSKFQVKILHYSESNVLKATYYGSEAYIRDDVVTYDDGVAVANANIIVEINDYIIVKTTRLYSQDEADPNYANQSLSRLIMHKITFNLT